MSEITTETIAQKKDRMRLLIKRLKKEYPEAECSLKYRSPHQLLIATILSAQCTDARVNQVTYGLFQKYSTVKDFAYADVEELAKDIHSCGYHHQKARAIKGACLIIWEEYNGVVPKTMDELLKLPGVGRKTANCVLGTAYHIPAVVVDTHMLRIMNLLEFSYTSNPEKMEKDIMKIAPPQDWIILTHLIIEHGRKVCIARRPQCNKCKLNDICPSSFV